MLTAILQTPTNCSMVCVQWYVAGVMNCGYADIGLTNCGMYLKTTAEVTKIYCLKYIMKIYFIIMLIM